MKNHLLLIIAAALMSACDTANTNKEVNLATFEDSASYAIGVSVGADLLENLDKDDLTGSGINTDLVLAGIRKSFGLDVQLLSLEQADSIIPLFIDKVSQIRADKNRAAGESFLTENKSKQGVVTTESGLQYIVLKQGEGDPASLSDEVVVHYTGKLLNGEVFDSSIERNEPVTFHVRSVIPGWTEALQLMNPGSEYKLFIPSALAYGENGGPRGSSIGPNEVLIFDVKLIDIVKE